MTALSNLEAVVEAFLSVANAASVAVSRLTEKGVCDDTSKSIDALVRELDTLGDRLPKTPEQCKTAVLLLCDHVYPQNAATISNEEALGIIVSIAALMSDFRTTLAGVLASEIDEMVEVGLPLARAAVAKLQEHAKSLESKVSPWRAASTVTIQDLDSGLDSCLAANLSCNITVRLSRRYVWRPLRPRLRQNVWPRVVAWVEAPTIPALAQNRPVLASAVALGCGPMAICTTACILSSALIADSIVQSAYEWKGPEFEDVLDSAAQTTTFIYLTCRFGGRRLTRLVEQRAIRLLGGRLPADVAVEVIQDFRQDPIGVTRLATGHVADGAHKVAEALLSGRRPADVATEIWVELRKDPVGATMAAAGHVSESACWAAEQAPKIWRWSTLWRLFAPLWAEAESEEHCTRFEG